MWTRLRSWNGLPCWRWRNTARNLAGRCSRVFRAGLSLDLRECVDQKSEVAPGRIQDGTCGAVTPVFIHLAASLLRSPGRGDAINQCVGHQVLGLVYLLTGGWPTQNGLDRLDDVGGHAGRLGYV